LPWAGGPGIADAVKAGGPGIADAVKVGNDDAD